jgi:hypothetical protein
MIAVALLVAAVWSLFLLATLDGHPLGIWNAIKAFLRTPFDWADRLCEREISAALEPEPDWAAAADEIGFFDPIPEPRWHLGELWTPAEREAYDLTSTQRFIDETDKILKGIEWQRFASTIPDLASARAIRRNGAQL